MTSDLQDLPVPQSQSQPGQLAVADVLRQSDLIQQVVKEVMVEGHHFGVIPGTEARPGEKKRPPVLLKPGAEKLCMVFRLAATFDVKTKDLPGGHREERVTCTLTHIPTGVVVTTALGSCSTMEAKYRYRNGKPKCPNCQAEQINRSKQEEGWYCWAKKGGCGAKFDLRDQRITSQSIGLAENKDLADTYNTVLKMAVKRAHVAAVLLATAASDAFVVEEDAPGDDEGPGDDNEPPPPPNRSRKQSPKKDAEPPQAKNNEPPPPERTPKQKLMAEAFAMQAELLKQGRTKDGLAELLGLHGIVVTKWGDLSEPELETVKKAFADELALGQPVQPQTGGKS